MNGDDVLRSTNEMRPRVAPFLEEGERFQVWVGASSGPAPVVKLAIDHVFPFLPERSTIVLVATDQRWLVLRSGRAEYRGRLTEVGTFPRDIRLASSWATRFDGFAEPIVITPLYALWVAAANDALEAQRAGRPWSLETAAAGLTEADADPILRRIEPIAMPLMRTTAKVLPPRPRFLRR